MQTARLLLAVVAVAPWCASACTGSCGCPNTGGSDAGVFVPASHSAADVQLSLAQCDLPHGPAVTPATFGDKRALMLGAWIECPPPSATVFHPAIAFRSDGVWRRLVLAGSGGLIPDNGPEAGGMYSFPLVDDRATDGNPYVTVTTAGVASTPANDSRGPMVLESSPSRLYVQFPNLDGAAIEVWLVPLLGP